MTFQEILLALGVAEETISSVIKEMMKYRIFLTKEEKIEERYQKLKRQREELKYKLEQCTSLLFELQCTSKEKEKQLFDLMAREKLIQRIINSEGSIEGIEEQLELIKAAGKGMETKHAKCN